MQWIPMLYSRCRYQGLLVHNLSSEIVMTYTDVVQKPCTTDDVVQESLAFLVKHY